MSGYYGMVNVARKVWYRKYGGGYLKYGAHVPSLFPRHDYIIALHEGEEKYEIHN